MLLSLKQNKRVCFYLLCAFSTAMPHFETRDQKTWFANRKAWYMLPTIGNLTGLLMLLLLPCNSICVSDKDNYLFLTWTFPEKKGKKTKQQNQQQPIEAVIWGNLTIISSQLICLNLKEKNLPPSKTSFILGKRRLYPEVVTRTDWKSGLVWFGLFFQ